MRKLIIGMSVGLLLSGCAATNTENDTKQVGKATTEEKGNTSTSEKKDNDLVLEAAYYNEIEEVDGKKVIVNQENILSMVNKEYYLSADYAPDDLVRPNVAFSFGEEDVEKSYLRKEAASALEKMFEAAKADGIILYGVSGYRSYSRQKGVFGTEVNRVGTEKAGLAVAIPGTSEHQSGLAMDISSEGEGFLLTDNFGEVKEGIWLRENAHRFGYILRYPKGKEDITGYQYESWHFRYVGEDAAGIIFKNDWTLEEYFENVEKI